MTTNSISIMLPMACRQLAQLLVARSEVSLATACAMVADCD